MGEPSVSSAGEEIHRARVCERLLGPAAQALLIRCAQAAPVSRERAEELRRQREEEFDRFLEGECQALLLALDEVHDMNPIPGRVIGP